MTAWILQVKGGEEPQFRLEDAIGEALKRDRTLWLAPLKVSILDGPENPGKGDRFYLNVSGEKAPDSSRIGKLVAIATALDKPLSHDMPPWQKKFLTASGLQEHKSESPRMHLHIDALIHPVWEGKGYITQTGNCRLGSVFTSSETAAMYFEAPLVL